MPPPVPTFPAHSLANAVQTTYDKTHDTQLRLRKDKINLKACKLLEMVQYECGINTEGLNKDTMVQCYPIVRLFRRYGIWFAWFRCDLKPCY